MTCFLHSADWQLGMTRHFLAGEAQARFSQDRFEAVRRMADLAGERNCEFAVVCGDIFETNQVEQKTVLRALEAMGCFRIPLYLLPGNHDPLDAASVFRSPVFLEHKPQHVHVLETAGIHPTGAGVELVAAPWFSKRPDRDLLAEACAGLTPNTGPDSPLRIAVGHGALDSLNPNRDDPASISVNALEQHLSAGELHYVALGDRHSCTNAHAGGRVWYAGAPEPTDYDELDPGRALVVELSREQCNVDAVAVNRWCFEQREFELDGWDDLEHLDEVLSQMPHKQQRILKLSLRGSLDLRQKAHLDERLEVQRDLFAAIELWERHSELVVRPVDEDFAALELSGFVDEAVRELRLRAQSEVEQEALKAQSALALLVRLAERVR